MGARLLLLLLISFVAPTAGIGQLFRNAPAEAPKPGNIRGTLVDKITGRAIGNATVIVSSVDGRGAAATVSTDRDGSFSAEVAPGGYILSAKKEGYIEGLYGSRFYGDPGMPISVGSGESAGNFTFALLPGGVIAGTVQNEDGEGFTNVTIRAMQYRYTSSGKRLLPVAIAITNDRGEYRLHGLRPGRYYVVCHSKRLRAITDSGKPVQGRYPLTFYPSVALIDNAAAISVTAGNEFVANITMTAAHSYKISGKVAGNDPGTVVSLSVVPRVETGDPPLEAKTDEFNRFTIDGALPGEYRLVGSGVVGRNPARSVRQITVDDGDLNDIVLPMPKPALPVNGYIHGSGLFKLGYDKLRVVLLPAIGETEDDADSSAPPTLKDGPHMDKSGRFEGITLSHPAKTAFATIASTSSDFADYYVESVDRQGEDVTYTGFDPTGAEYLGITVSPNGGVINGAVAGANGHPFPGATVLLYPEEAHMLRPDLYHATKADQNGEFSIHGIAPGTYRLLAWEQVEPAALYDPDFLKLYEHDSRTARIEKSGKYDITLTLVSEPDGSVAGR